MKKTKIFALMMTCAILLSTIIIPFSATETGNTNSIDGKANEATWANPTATYELALQTNTPVSPTSTREDTTPAIAKFSYDSEYLYLYYETTNPARAGYQAINVQIRPNNSALPTMKGANYSANGEALLLKVGLKSTTFNQCTGTTVDGVTTYVWKGSDPTTNLALLDKFGYSMDSCASNTGTYSYKEGNYYHDLSEVAVTVEGDKKTVEVKFPLAESYKTALQTADGASLRVGFWEITGYSGSDTTEAATNASNGGYVVDANNYGWSGEQTKGAVLNLPALFETEDPVFIDGKANEATWTNPTATYELALQVDTPVSSTSRREDSTPAIAKFSYDSEYLYLYYETTNPARAGYQAINVQIRPNNSALPTMKGANYSANGEALLLKVGLKSTTFNQCTGTTVDGVTTYVWKGSDPTTNLALLDKFGYSMDSCASNTGTYSYKEGNYYHDLSEVAVTVEGDKKTVEVKFPLAESYKTALLTMGGASLRVGFWEITGYSGSDTTEAATNASNGGYVVDATNYDWNGGQTKGAVLNLPAIYNAKTAPVLAGFDSEPNATDNTKYDVRFVSVVDEYDGFVLNTSKVGYVLTNGDEETEQYCSELYTELEANGTTIKASNFGGKYFFCFTITGLDPDQTYDLNVKCFTRKDATAPKEFCALSTDVQITYNTAENKAVFCVVNEQINLIDLTNYQIVIPGNSTTNNSVESLSAYELKDALASMGYSLNVVQDNGAASVDNKSVLIGQTAATEGEMPSGNQYSITVDATGRIQISAGTYYGYRTALARIQNYGGIPMGSYSGEARPANADRTTSDSVRVMFYNVLGYAWKGVDGNDAASENTPPVALRQDLQRDILSAYAPDVIGLQEYTTAYRSVFNTIMTGLEYTEVSTTKTNNNSPIFYRADKVTIVESGFESYTGTSATHNRGVTWAVFTKNGTNKQFAVLNTHFLDDGNAGGSEAGNTERENNAAKVLDVISSIKAEYGDVAVIFGGDLNFKNGSGTAYTSLTNGGLTLASEIGDVQTNVGYTHSVHGFYLYDGGNNVYDMTQSNLINNSKSQYTLEYVFIGDELSSITVQKYIFVKEDATFRASDHSPTLVDFILN